MNEIETNEEKKIGTAYLCLHGHFYQPPRDDPFTGHIPIEPAATPFANFNEKITTECYRPNTEVGNFDAINFDLGPTLAAWLEDAHEDVYQCIIEADRKHLARYGVGNAMAQLIGKAVGKEPRITLAPPLLGEVTHYVADITKARELLGYDPQVPLDEGIPLTPLGPLH